MADRYAGHSATFKVGDELIEFRYGDEIPSKLPKSVRDGLRDAGGILNEEPAPAPAATSDETPATIDEILADVGEDKEKAQTALDTELAASKPRTTLVDKLRAITTA